VGEAEVVQHQVQLSLDRRELGGPAAPLLKPRPREAQGRSNSADNGQDDSPRIHASIEASADNSARSALSFLIRRGSERQAPASAGRKCAPASGPAPRSWAAGRAVPPAAKGAGPAGP